MTEKVEEGIVIEGEGKESHANPQVAEDKYTAQALKKGWAPEDQWKGNPDDWVPAKEFLGRQKLFNRIDDLKEAVKKAKTEADADVKLLAKQLAEVRAETYKKALADLKAQRAVALEDRDTATLEAVEEQIDETKSRLATAEADAKKEVQKAQAQESEAFKSWKSENKWFADNQEMRDDAIAIGVGFAAKNPDKTEREVYEYVTNRIRKIYPDEFATKQKQGGDEEDDQGGRKVSNVEGNNSPSRPAAGSKKTRATVMADLDEQARAVAKTLIKRNAFKEEAAKLKISQEEYYLRTYDANK